MGDLNEHRRVIGGWVRKWFSLYSFLKCLEEWVEYKVENEWLGGCFEGRMKKYGRISKL